MAKRGLVYTILAMLLFLGSCSAGAPPQKTDMQKHEWQATTCAPKAFPIRLLSATVHLADSGDLGIQPISLLSNGWGETGPVSIVGDDMKASPVALEIQWFSYVERKCYGGRFDLDPELFNAVFKEKLIAPASDARVDYNYLIVGMAPEGAISLWLTGEGVTREIVHLKAPEIQVDMQEVIGAYPNVEAYATDVIVKNRAGGDVVMSKVPADDFSKWAGRYRKPYNWHFAVHAIAPLKGMLAHYFNGENYYWPQKPDSTMTFRHPLPDALTVRWETGTSHHLVTLQLDDAELFAAFDRLGGPDQEAGIQVEMNRVTRTGKVFIQNGSNIIELKKTRMEEY